MTNVEVIDDEDGPAGPHRAPTRPGEGGMHGRLRRTARSVGCRAPASAPVGRRGRGPEFGEPQSAWVASKTASLRSVHGEAEIAPTPRAVYTLAVMDARRHRPDDVARQ